MLIGLGGGGASSGASGSGDEALDFASVQRQNPEMQRRCQEVIDRCWQLGADNPILSIHDVGAGGLSNALPELVDGAGRGGRIELRAIPCDDPTMSPLEIWCNESQERYVLAVDPGRLAGFAALCERERCPWADVGEVTRSRLLRVDDAGFGSTPVSMPMSVLLGGLPRMRRHAVRVPPVRGRFDTRGIEIGPALERVLRMPAVADKSFLVTIGDRSVGGLVARDQMVGPWQVPVADCAVTLSGFRGFTGEAVAMGERAPLALLDPRAAARMAVAEALTNLAAADVASLDRVVLSANWMAACGEPGEDANLFDAVEAVAMELCPALGISIPVGKDSLSMTTTWSGDAGPRRVVSPLSLVVSAFAPVEDARLSLVPMLCTGIGESSLLLVDPGDGANRLGGSALALSHERLGALPPDLDRPEAFPALFRALSRLRRETSYPPLDGSDPPPEMSRPWRDGRVLAYHDRSDGGLAACVLEMAFAGRAGFDVDLEPLGPDPIAALFCEEPGAVLQVLDADLDAVRAIFDSEPSLAPRVHRIGRVEPGDTVRFRAGSRTLYEASRTRLHRIWSETSYRMQRLRDDPRCADEERARIADAGERGLWCEATFDVEADVRAGPRAPLVAHARPRVAILREQGVNGHVEMAAAFDAGDFDAFDVHMSDLAGGRISLTGFTGLAACGGFSFGDVLGAGAGWAYSIRFNPRCRDEFAAFFRRGDTFTLGVCNGCQMLARLRDLIPGAGAWPPLRAQPLRAVRGTPPDDPDRRLPVALPQGNGRLGAPHRGRARRGPCGLRRRRPRPRDPRRSRLPAIRGVERRSGRALSRQSERFRGRGGRGHHTRRARDDHDAAPGAHHPGRTALLASPVLGRARPVVAHVQERPEVGSVSGVGGRAGGLRRIASWSGPRPAPRGPATPPLRRRKEARTEIAMTT